MQHTHAPPYSAAELAWLHTLVGYGEPALLEPAVPALSKAERLARRKARNRDSASGSRERRNAHLRALQAAVRELERENAGLVAQIELETALNVMLQHQA
jgi:hypothetical protein